MASSVRITLNFAHDNSASKRFLLFSVRDSLQLYKFQKHNNKRFCEIKADIGMQTAKRLNCGALYQVKTSSNGLGKFYSVLRLNECSSSKQRFCTRLISVVNLSAKQRADKSSSTVPIINGLW